MLAEAGNMSQNPEPARIPPLGRILSRELDVRGWTQKDLAEVMNRPAQAIDEIIRGIKQIPPEIAYALSEALGTSPDFWANLESKYRLHLANKEDVKASLRRALEQATSGQRLPLSQMWDGIDNEPAE
jgi:plasmid maintenance system antidote protein VapI